MRILLIANYLLDEQQSMLRFAEMLETGFRNLGHEVRTIRPEPIMLKKLQFLPKPLHKWLAYIDKFLLFPRRLRQEAPWADIVHICDHSNSMYTQSLPRAVVTCHDLLAVRGALGEDTDCPASSTGRILQRWILSGLRKATLIICDSTHTLQDVHRLVGDQVPAKVALLGLNYTYRHHESPPSLETIATLKDGTPYLLHVGSNLARKNKEGILRIFAALKDRWEGKLVFAGPPLSENLATMARDLGVYERIVEVVNPDNLLLEALYNSAVALLFPSRFEGFGWPPLEAQSCGCPVICSDCGSIPEVVADSAMVFALHQEREMAEAVLALSDPKTRQIWVERGFANVKRFSVDGMIRLYETFYTQSLQR
jgi:glycosyltransferase involved in cell wall biosynthesis